MQVRCYSYVRVSTTTTTTTITNYYYHYCHHYYYYHYCYHYYHHHYHHYYYHYCDGGGAPRAPDGRRRSLRPRNHLGGGRPDGEACRGCGMGSRAPCGAPPNATRR